MKAPVVLLLAALLIQDIAHAQPVVAKIRQERKSYGRDPAVRYSLFQTQQSADGASCLTSP